MEKLEFLQTFQEVCLAYRMPLNEKETLVYYKYLKQYNIDEFKLATSNIITNIKYKYFPKINEYKIECENAKRKIAREKQLKIEENYDEVDCDIVNFFTPKKNN